MPQLKFTLNDCVLLFSEKSHGACSFSLEKKWLMADSVYASFIHLFVNQILIYLLSSTSSSARENKAGSMHWKE